MLKKLLKTSLEKTTEHVYAQIKPRIDRKVADQGNVDVVLAMALNEKKHAGELVYPVFYTEILREYWQRDQIKFKVIKGPEDHADLRRNSIVRELEAFPPLEYKTACDLAAFAEFRLRDTSPFSGTIYAGSNSFHFYFSSALGRKSRILYNIVRSRRPARCLEIGTAWGMSTSTIAEAQRSLGLDANVITLEPNEPQHSKAREALAARYAGSVLCMKARSEEVLPVFRKEGRTFDFVFDDGAHTGDAYVYTFQNTVDLLEPGAVILVDDIRWDAGANRWKTSQDSKRSCYEGWLEIVRDDRVSLALEIGSGLGMIFVK